MEIFHKVNNLLNSVTYIIKLPNGNTIFIDPGSSINTAYVNSLDNSKEHVVLLTHEHADHCIGVNVLNNAVSPKIICSEKCSKNIKNSKENYSLYAEEISAFEIEKEPTVIKDNEVFEVCNLTIKLLETPGHSPGSACYILGKKIFTGDTLLNGVKTPLNFTHSDKLAYKASIKKLKKIIKPDTVIFPGHGLAFRYENLNWPFYENRTS